MLQTGRSLADQVYDAVVAEICRGTLAPGTHLVQERIAERFGVSRQPVQQAMTRLRADGVVEEIGRRGLFVAALDPARVRDHYGVRAALDGWAARMAAGRAARDPAAAAAIAAEGRALVEAGAAAVRRQDVAVLVDHDNAFHFMLYAASGNALLAPAAEPHWRFLRRAMGSVLRDAEPPNEIWRQHAEILDAVLAGAPERAQALAVAHVETAARLLAEALAEEETAR